MTQKNQINAPWQVVQNWHGKIAIVDCTNDGKTTTVGRVCNLPHGRNGRGLFLAHLICRLVNQLPRD